MLSLFSAIFLHHIVWYACFNRYHIEVFCCFAANKDFSHTFRASHSVVRRYVIQQNRNLFICLFLELKRAQWSIHWINEKIGKDSVPEILNNTELNPIIVQFQGALRTSQNRKVTIYAGRADFKVITIIQQVLLKGSGFSLACSVSNLHEDCCTKKHRSFLLKSFILFTVCRVGLAWL